MQKKQQQQQKWKQEFYLETLVKSSKVYLPELQATPMKIKSTFYV